MIARRVCLGLVLAASASIQVPATAAQPAPIALGTLGGSMSYASGINDRGQVIGYSTIAPDGEESHAFLWENGVMRDLGSGATPLEWAGDINDRGQIVGLTGFSDGTTKAALWEGGRTTYLATLPGSTYCRANAISHQGLIAGVCVVGADPVDAELVGVLWWQGAIARMRVPPGVQLYPVDINDRGAVVGTAFVGTDTFEFVWQYGVLTEVSRLARRMFYQVVAINRQGLIAGSGPGAFPVEALLWTGRTTVAFGAAPGTAGSVAYGLNNHGDVIGHDGSAGVVWTNGRRDR